MSLNAGKSDAELGYQIHNHLIMKGVETPMLADAVSQRQFNLPQIEQKFAEILDLLGMDRRDDSIEETPKRLAKMYAMELMGGMDYLHFPKCTTVDNKMKYDEMVLERNITVKSLCEHHLVPIVGKAHIAYIPGEKVVGLSKLNRVVEFFSRRPQIQERLTEQVYFTLQYLLETDDIAVVVDGVHLCVSHRGVNDNTSSTVTSKLGGCFKEDPAVRAEFMRLYQNGG